MERGHLELHHIGCQTQFIRAWLAVDGRGVGFNASVAVAVIPGVHDHGAVVQARAGHVQRRKPRQRVGLKHQVLWAFKLGGMHGEGKAEELKHGFFHPKSRRDHFHRQIHRE